MICPNWVLRPLVSSRGPGGTRNQIWASKWQPQDFHFKYQTRGAVSSLGLRTEAWVHLATAWEEGLRTKQHRTKRWRDTDFWRPWVSGSSCTKTLNFSFSELISSQFPSGLSQFELLSCPVLLKASWQTHSRWSFSCLPNSYYSCLSLGCQKPPAPARLKMLPTCCPASLTAGAHDPTLANGVWGEGCWGRVGKIFHW